MSGPNDQAGPDAPDRWDDELDRTEQLEAEATATLFAACNAFANLERCVGVQPEELCRDRIVTAPPKVVSEIRPAFSSLQASIRANTTASTTHKRQYISEKRKPKENQQPLVQQRCSIEKSRTVCVASCCVKHSCVRQFLPEEVLALRKYHASLSSEQRREFLHNLMRSGSNMAAMNTKRDWKPAAVICGYPVCFKAISIIYNISTATIATAVKSAKAIPHDTALLAHGNKGTVLDPKATTEHAINWMKTKFDQLAQEDPRSSTKWLPSTAYTTKVAVWGDYTKDTTAGRQVVCYDYFIKLWKKHFNNVAFTRHNPFARCDLCDQLSKAITMCTARAQEEHSGGLSALRAARERHLSKQAADRTHYHGMRRDAHDPDSGKMCMILDGMSKWKTNVPAPMRHPKGLDNGSKLELQLLGVKCHGYRNFGFFYLGGQGFMPSNLTCSAILHVLNQFQQDRGDLPDNLYLQLDNCASENKNHTVFGFLAYLVQTGVFKTIEIGFMTPGHTHEDIDGMFGTFSSYLLRHDVLTIDDMMRAFEAAISNKAEKDSRADTEDSSVYMSAVASVFVSSVPDFQKIFSHKGTGVVREFAGFGTCKLDPENRDINFRNQSFKLRFYKGWCRLMSKLTMHAMQWHPVGQEGPEAGWRVFETHFEWDKPITLEAQKMVVMAKLPEVYKHVKAWCHKWEGEIEVFQNPGFGLQPLPSSGQRMTASEQTLHNASTHAKRSLETWQGWMAATTQQVGDPLEWLDNQPPLALAPPPLLLTMKSFPAARHQRERCADHLSEQDEVRITRLAQDDHHLRPWVGPISCRGKMQTAHQDAVEVADIVEGRMLITRAADDSCTSYDDIPFDVCRIVKVPPEFEDDESNVPIGVEFYTVDREPDRNVQWYKRAFLRVPMFGKEGCFGNVLFSDVVLWFPRLDEPLIQNNADRREVVRRKVVGLLPDVVESSCKKIKERIDIRLEHTITSAALKMASAQAKRPAELASTGCRNKKTKSFTQPSAPKTRDDGRQTRSLTRQ